jgi:hypothetical protein
MRRSGHPVLALQAVPVAVEPILNGVVAAPGKMLGNLGPFIPKLLVKTQDLGALFCRDGIVSQAWLEVLLPPLPALLGRPSFDYLGRNPNPGLVPPLMCRL